MTVDAVPWYLPLLIVLARVCDVSIGTVRMMCVIQGYRALSAVLGFFEVIVWALAVGGVIQHLNHPLALISYGTGFALGTLTGMWLEARMAMGLRMVRVVNANREVNVTDQLRNCDYRATRLAGEGARGPVEIAFVIVRRRGLAELLKRIEQIAPEAMVTVERAEHARGAEFMTDPRAAWPQWLRPMSLRK